MYVAHDPKDLTMMRLNTTYMETTGYGGPYPQALRKMTCPYIHNWSKEMLQNLPTFKGWPRKGLIIPYL